MINDSPPSRPISPNRDHSVAQRGGRQQLEIRPATLIKVVITGFGTDIPLFDLLLETEIAKST
jgi:hypothetical protein